MAKITGDVLTSDASRIWFVCVLSITVLESL